MVTKAVLLGEAVINRRTTVTLPEGVTGQELVGLLNNGVVKQVHQVFECAGRFKAAIADNQVVSEVGLWLLDSTFEAQEEAHGCECGHCHPSPGEQLMQKAAVLTQCIAERAAAGDVRTARHLAAAAWTLYDLAGGGLNETYIWLLTSKQFIASAAKHHQTASKHGRKAFKTAKALFGEDHHLFAVVNNNYAEALVDEGRIQLAEEHLRVGIAVLDKTIAAGGHLKDWAIASRVCAVNNLRRALEISGRFEEAAALV